jgi:hypothetical protein
MSRASNLAGFTTAVGPPTDLNVGVVTATRIDADNITASNTYTFNNLNLTGIASIAHGVYSPVGVSTFLSVDVATIDSNTTITGVITTQNDIHVTGAGSSIGIGTAVPKVSLDASEKTDAIGLPKGTTAQRPTGVEGFIRFNSTSKALEIYDGTNWVEIITDYFPSGSVILG